MGRKKLGEVRYAYVATVTVPPAHSSFASAERRQAAIHEQYRALCLVRKQSSIRSVEDLREMISAGHVKILMPDPLSVSGRLAPLVAMRASGMNIAVTPTYSQSHSNSIRTLLGGSTEVEQVAFVWDGVSIDDTNARQLRRIEFPELEKLNIPGDVIVARADWPLVNDLQGIVLSQPDSELRVMADWHDQYGKVRRWLADLGAPAQSETAQQVTLSQLAEMLLHDARSQPVPPRIALVLPGGGAKCAFQVGAIAAIEEEFGALREKSPDTPVDIGLVVGTSGGAINSLPVAVGVSASAEGREDFQTVWSQLDQRDLVRPSWPVRANIGIWFAIAQVMLTIAVVRRFWHAKASRQRRLIWIILLTLAAIELAVAYVPVNPWRMLGNNHVIHHVWLWGTFGGFVSGWVLLAICGTSLAAQSAPAFVARRLFSMKVYARPLMWGGLLVLPLVQVLAVLFGEETLSDSTSIQRAYATEFPRLFDAHLKRSGGEALSLSASDDGRRLHELSQQIIERRLLKRDLVVTASCLTRTSDTLPIDLYFYMSADPNRAVPAFGPRGISLADHPRVLMDVVLGSGSIYPVFPARKVADFPASGESVELIDGGFAHNSPLEAAVLWGATHIILIEASPDERRRRGAFLHNIRDAFEHLYSQAQRIDTQSKGKVALFTLAPSSPHLCVLDFADNLIEQAIDKGYREAREVAPGQQAGFRKELGLPKFWDARQP